MSTAGGLERAERARGSVTDDDRRTVRRLVAEVRSVDDARAARRDLSAVEFSIVRQTAAVEAAIAAAAPARALAPEDGESSPDGGRLVASARAFAGDGVPAALLVGRALYATASKRRCGGRATAALAGPIGTRGVREAREISRVALAARDTRRVPGACVVRVGIDARALVGPTMDTAAALFTARAVGPLVAAELRLLRAARLRRRRGRPRDASARPRVGAADLGPEIAVHAPALDLVRRRRSDRPLYGRRRRRGARRDGHARRARRDRRCDRGLGGVRRRLGRCGRRRGAGGEGPHQRERGEASDRSFVVHRRGV